ncbi:hypothetical protein [Nonomuraea sp. B5E05]|uniref:hypothetical protein n=1 Tax=Nonomuraea sp. B5E05 TaxID=3153569 RepID=UPI0032604DF0
MKGLAAAACATIGLLAVTATPATAADGRLILSGAGHTSTLSDPRPGCYRTASPFTTVTNATDTAVTVYTGPGCTGSARTVRPGPTTPVGERLSVSVPS